MPTAIKVENLSKAYQLGQIGTGTISRDLERYWAKVGAKKTLFYALAKNYLPSLFNSQHILFNLAIWKH